MKHWIAIGIWSAASALAMSTTTRASGQAADSGVEDAGAVEDGGADDAGALADGGASDAGAAGDSGAKDASAPADAGEDEPAPFPDYDLIQRDDGGRACSAGGPGGSTNELSMIALLGLSAVIVRRRARR